MMVQLIALLPITKHPWRMEVDRLVGTAWVSCERLLRSTACPMEAHRGVAEAGMFV